MALKVEILPLPETDGLYKMTLTDPLRVRGPDYSFRINMRGLEAIERAVSQVRSTNQEVMVAEIIQNRDGSFRPQ